MRVEKAIIRSGMSLDHARGLWMRLDAETFARRMMEIPGVGKGGVEELVETFVFLRDNTLPPPDLTVGWTGLALDRLAEEVIRERRGAFSHA